MTSKSGSEWRDKYLDALDEQERLQKSFEQQQHVLRRALVRVSLAAEGHNANLDRDLQHLRGAVKTGSADLESAMTAVEASLLTFERQRDAQHGTESVTLVTMTEALQEHLRESQIKDRSLQKSLKGFAKAVQKGEAGSVTEQLKQFKWLQAQAFQALIENDSKSPRPGLMDRLLGRSGDPDAGGEAVPDAEPSSQSLSNEHQASSDESLNAELEISDQGSAAPDTKAPEEIFGEADDSPELSHGSERSPEPLSSQMRERETELVGQLQTKAEAKIADEARAELQLPVNEPAFSRISAKVTRVLNELLDNVEPVDCTEQKVSNARQRIERGLNWYELVPTLEDIRDLVLQAYLIADEEYREYLRQIHQVLETIVAGLGVTVEKQQEWLLADQAFDQALEQHLGSLGRSVAVATEVEALKFDVNEHLQTIQAALTQKQSSSAKSELGEKLAELVAQVKQVEQEAAAAKAELEEQKIKAVTDALTGLPNREAYNERGFHEWNRWQRYGHPLTIVVCDIDHFKKINDTYGHQAGDRVLQVLSNAMSKRLREVDFMARYGGEEFVILLPETPQAQGFEVMDKIRSVIASTPFRFKQVPVQVTFSMGIVGLKQGDTLESAFALADELLYKAKEAGRNCCKQDERAGGQSSSAST